MRMYEYQSLIDGTLYYSSAKLQDLYDIYDNYGLPIFYSLQTLFGMESEEIEEAFSYLEELIM